MSTATEERSPGTRTGGLLIDSANLALGDGDSTVQALANVSLTVRPGEMVAVVGPSGAGKSSLLAVAGALTIPDSGTVRVNGVDLATLGKAARARFRLQEIGFVFQSGNLIPALNSAEQLRLMQKLAGTRDTLDPLELLAAVGMDHKARSRPDQLSGGERQRVGIARSLVNRPSLLLVDEPTAALDRARSQDVVALLARETHERGVATVMVTHDHDVLHHCDRVVEMVDGRLSS
ncbi:MULTISPECIES: ABC transporter ATP-binding protein [unclassified Arthrobacter]|uniref:ABC transporter ATP-binding protein n=1 Tax=unclassified Arthrobacter TaxID=235627 RepID=UPI001D14207A|nr:MULTISPECIES: ABC transporter ATP-binding protein [unclassified Arthrobacter]MCC3291213.1 ABC transporter ATP-binding protein [Arthrobacter sp. zg-Y1110]MCC3301385.1 ABC transporter ATP-binding protein [Arthrobacter sp. zg-Y895]UWX83642.1 ABC transporter ATP-binding protein [Arthrobacter sp. zg-Y1110]